MKKKSISQSGWFLHTQYALLFAQCVYSDWNTIGVLHPHRLRTLGKNSDVPERVSYQRALRSYWRHRISPKERPDSKPSLDAVCLRQAGRKSQFISRVTGARRLLATTITAELLRLNGPHGQHTKQPECVARNFLKHSGMIPFNRRRVPWPGQR